MGHLREESGCFRLSAYRVWIDLLYRLRDNQSLTNKDVIVTRVDLGHKTKRASVGKNCVINQRLTENRQEGRLTGGIGVSRALGGGQSLTGGENGMA